MEIEQTEKTPEQLAHESNKEIREKLAWAHYKLTYVATLPEEHQMHQASLGMLAALCTDLQQKIEAVEPPPKKDDTPKAPYIVDVPSRG